MLFSIQRDTGFGNRAGVNGWGRAGTKAAVWSVCFWEARALLFARMGRGEPRGEVGRTRRGAHKKRILFPVSAGCEDAGGDLGGA